MSNRPIILAASDAAFEDRLRTAYEGALNGNLRRFEPKAGVDDVQHAVAAISRHGPDVVAVGPSVTAEKALEFAQALDVSHPEISVIMIAERSPALLEAALQAGVRDVLPPGATGADIRMSFDRALATAEKRRNAITGEAGPASGGPRSRVITVMSPKGGAGKTTVATNLALGLAGAGAGKVAVVDIDLQFGDVSTAMSLMPEHSIADAAKFGAGLDAMSLKLLLTPHPSGVYALCGPDNPADGEEVTAEAVTRSVQLLAEEFPFVVVDTAAGITEETLAAADISTDLILVCTFDVPSVRSLRKVVHALDQLGMMTQRRHFVLNRADSRVGLATEDVEATIGMTVDIAVPSSRAVPLSMNQGSPLIESDPRSPAARQMLELTKRFVEQMPQPQSGGGPRFFKRGQR